MFSTHTCINCIIYSVRQNDEKASLEKDIDKLEKQNKDLEKQKKDLEKEKDKLQDKSKNLEKDISAET